MVIKKPTKAPSVSAIKKQLTEAKKQAEEYKETLQRLQAEFDNYRKRIEAEKPSLIASANKELVTKLLEVLDSFDRALSAKLLEDPGLKLIHKQIYTTLESEGLSLVQAIGNKFDPQLHEALSCKESDCEGDIILEEVRKGYLFKSKPIRPAQVIISKSKENKEEQKNGK